MKSQPETKQKDRNPKQEVYNANLSTEPK